MKKILALLFALAFAALAHAEPGSFCKATFAFTVKQTRDIADVINSNGSVTEGVKVRTTKIGNLEILAEAKRTGIISGSISGWSIYTMHDADAFQEVVAIKNLQMVSLKPIIDIIGFGTAEKGTWVRRGSKIKSGTVSSESTAIIRFTIGTNTYETVGHFAGSETIREVNLSRVWVNNNTESLSIAGAGEKGELVTGSLKIAKGVAVMSLSPVFLP